MSVFLEDQQIDFPEALLYNQTTCKISLSMDEQPPKKSNSLKYFGILIIPFVIFLLGLTVGYNQAKQDVHSTNGSQENTNTSDARNENSASKNGTIGADFDLFWDIWGQIDQNYINGNGIDQDKMMYGAIKGMVAALDDPYTLFMDPKETEEFRNSLSGDLEGIGAELTIRDNNVVIVSPLKDSPAEKAGVLPGDIIYKIDDKVATNMTLTDAVLRIRGEKGTTVNLSIVREEQEEPIEVAIVRDEIKVPSISWEMMDDEIAYVSINQFGDDTTKEFENAVTSILLKKPKGILLDLRFNGGGYLEGAIDIISEFIEQGLATTVERSLEEDTEVHKVHGHARLAEVLLVVLINEGSASASEIVAGAIKDHERGTLVGEKTFGKGTVQELRPQSDGSSLRITIAKWVTPDGNDIDGVGISPDVEIENETNDAGELEDKQLEKALELLQEQLN